MSMDWGRGGCLIQDAPNVMMCTYDVPLVGIAAEAGKHKVNDQKYRELSWVCACRGHGLKVTLAV